MICFVSEARKESDGDGFNRRKFNFGNPHYYSWYCNNNSEMATLNF